MSIQEKEDKRISLNMHLNPIQQSRICYKNMLQAAKNLD